MNFADSLGFNGIIGIIIATDPPMKPHLLMKYRANSLLLFILVAIIGSALQLVVVRADNTETGNKSSLSVNLLNFI